MLEQLICFIHHLSKKHMGRESNYLTDKSKFREKVYVLKIFYVPNLLLLYKYMITIFFLLLEA